MCEQGVESTFTPLLGAAVEKIFARTSLFSLKLACANNKLPLYSTIISEYLWDTKHFSKEDDHYVLPYEEETEELLKDVIVIGHDIM